MRRAALALLVATGSAAPEPDGVATLLAEADRRFEARALGAQAERCSPAEVNAALAGYRLALAAEPDSIPAHAGSLRALFFRGAFCGESGSKQRDTFEEAKRLAEAAQGVLERRAGARVKREHPERFRDIPGAPALIFWCGLAWGQWALDHKLAAAWQGAGGRIRELAETAVALDPGYEQGAPHVVLGRLHVEGPRIPLLTGFVSRKKGLEQLRKAWELSRSNSVALWFLADAILAHDPARRAEAVGLLRTLATLEPRASYVVEDRHYAALGRARLLALGEAP